MMFGVVMVFAILAMAGTALAEYVRTQGYWKNHPDDPAWTALAILPLTIAGVTYDTAEETIPILQTPVKGDKSYNLFDAVITAWLNWLSGAFFIPGDGTYEAFNEALLLLQTYPPGSGLAANSDAWKQAEPWFNELQAFNSGLRAYPHAD